MTTYTYTTLSDPSAAPGGSTDPVSINDKVQVTGYYYNGTTVVGFLYSDGTWTTLSDPSAAPGGSTNPVAINDRGQVTGSYFNGTIAEGFLYSDGTYTTLSDPSAGADGSTFSLSINDRGQVIGYLQRNGTDQRRLCLQQRHLDHPERSLGGFSSGNAYTVPTSINDRGQVIGYYFNGTTEAGFLYSNGTYTTLSDPSAGCLTGPLTPVSINDKGQVIGYYNNGTNLRRLSLQQRHLHHPERSLGGRLTRSHYPHIYQ